ncbi:hypothetical protein GQ53DRAFT_639108 [Thozetella sp. PMI_491]|nr:hypothetical protein GQ53DRAFT_639108 [Thozetella sp. PMI_491]
MPRPEPGSTGRKTAKTALSTDTSAFESGPGAEGAQRRSASPPSPQALRAPGAVPPDLGSASVASTSEDKEKPEKPVSHSRAARHRDIPACDRCRSFKKRCSRTFPVCSLCASAGQKCSFATSVTSAAAQTHHLRARIEWLSRYINENLPVGAGGVESIETGVNLAELRHSTSPSGGADLEARSMTPGSGFSSQDLPMIDTPGVDGVVHEGTTNPQPQRSVPAPTSAPEPYRLEPTTKEPILAPLSDDAAARRFVDAYFRNVNRAYPFVDRVKVLRDLELFGDFATRKRDPDSTLLFLIMAIGCTTLQRAGQIPAGTADKFEVPYDDIIRECLVRENIESVRILVLLALYSLFDPAGVSSFSIIGIVSRQAMLLGLTRRSSEDKTISATEVELRHRLYWSIFVFDRMMAVQLGLPVSLTDENTDVPLPGLTIEEFAAPERPQFATILQTSRQVIQLRQIEDKILRSVHFSRSAKVASLTHADRRAILEDIRAEIENWYSSGCLVSPLEPDILPIHNSISWLSARYYHMLILLYYPSQFNTFGSVVSKTELLKFAQKHLQSTSVLFQQRQLPLNRITLYRFFPIGLITVHGFIACAAEGTAFTAREEVGVIINILDAFPDGWLHARQGAHLFRQFLNIIAEANSYGPYIYINTQAGTTKESWQTLLRPTISALVLLMQDVLGKTTCYSVQELSDERDAIGLGTAVQSQAQPLTSPVAVARGPLQQAPIPPQAQAEDTQMNYGWGSLELDFL